MVYVNIAVTCAVIISIGFVILAVCSLCDLILSIRYARMREFEEDAAGVEQGKGDDDAC